MLTVAIVPQEYATGSACCYISTAQIEGTHTSDVVSIVTGMMGRAAYHTRTHGRDGTIVSSRAAGIQMCVPVTWIAISLHFTTPMLTANAAFTLPFFRLKCSDIETETLP